MISVLDVGAVVNLGYFHESVCACVPVTIILVLATTFIKNLLH